MITEICGALNDIGYTLPGQNWTYWNKGPGPGEEEWDTTTEKEWTLTTGQAMASNLAAVATALQATPIPARLEPRRLWRCGSVRSAAGTFGENYA